jgi:putative serine protease PepD
MERCYFGSNVILRLLTIAALGGCVATAEAQQEKQAKPPLSLTGAPPIPRGAQLFRMVERSGPLPQGELRANDEREKGGPSGAVYARVAPAVVYISSEDGSGTGFIIDDEGRLLTNHHVVSDPALDDETGARRVSVALGLLESKDSTMSPIKKWVKALVYKEDPVKDLALLKLVSIPPEVKSLAKIELAEASPHPTDTCIAIGHPSGGHAWTVRVGHVTSIGRWPDASIEESINLLDAKESVRGALKQGFRSAPARQVVFSDCAIGGGDSGGPLLDESGRLVAVTFAIAPAGPKVARLAYHIHLDEVRSFLAEKPANPLTYEPDPWAGAVPLANPVDLDEDNKPETLLVTVPGESFDSILVDLSQKSRCPEIGPETDLDQLRKEWRPSFALTLVGRRPYKAYYDCDDDQVLDRVLMLPLRQDAAVDRSVVAVQRKNQRWFKGESRRSGLIDSSLIPDPEKQRRLEVVVAELSRLLQAAGRER